MGTLFGVSQSMALGIDTPTSYEDISDVVNSQIPDALNAAQCGGWNMQESVGSTLGTGRIAKVIGAPGREGEPLGDPSSGLATRIERGGVLNDGYLYPATAKGLATACVPGRSAGNTLRTHWQDGTDGAPGEYVEDTVQYPAFGDPPCKWEGQPGDPIAQESDIPMTPARCQSFCDWLNSFTYSDCQSFEPVLERDDEKGTERIIGYRCADDGWAEKYTCTEEWAADGAVNLPNCRTCEGDECRCPGPGCQTIPARQATNGRVSAPAKVAKTYQSFFRTYDIETKRAGVTEAPMDQLENVHAVAACYGFYDEFDPKTTLVGDRRQCVIGFPFSREDNNAYALSPIGLKTSQQGKGTYASPRIDTPPEDRSMATANGWETGPSNMSFALPNTKDLSHLFLSPDTAVTRGGPATPTTLMRSADETEAITKWWNGFLSEMLQLLSPPTVRLKLPAALAPILPSLPLDPLAPITVRSGTKTQTIASGEMGDIADRWESIEVQLQAKEDLLGTIAKRIEESMTLRMEPVPVVVPLASPTTLRALAQRWQDYKNQRQALGYPPPEGVDTLIAKLEDYADGVERYGELRTVLPRYVSALVTRQRQILLGVDSWMADNLERYQEYLADRKRRLSYAPRVRALQALELSTTDGANLPWCRLDTFTVPLYSLLDPWMPGRPTGKPVALSCDGTDGTLPSLCLQPETDMIFDLSVFHTSRTSVRVPVPMVVPVNFQLPTPPPADGPPPDAKLLELPSLPPVPEIDEQLLAALPTVDMREPSPPTMPASTSIIDDAAINGSMDQAEKILTGMHDAYARFWQSIEPSEETNGLQCPGWNQGVCIHTEPELLQSFMRIVSMPLVYLREHREAAAKASDTCSTENGACLPSNKILMTGPDGWQTITPKDTDASSDAILQSIRKDARRSTIGDDGQLQTDPDTDKPYPYANSAESFYPIFDVPGTIDLFPPKK